jgi:hypothetical protein
MNPIQHHTNNDVLAPPPGVPRDECKPLYITRVWYHTHQSLQAAIPGVISYWRPTPEQLALLNAGKPLFLSFMGATHPPVAVGVEGDGRLEG